MLFSLAVICALNLCLCDESNVVMQIIERNGYPAEEHNVITKDGYHIALHRISRGKISSKPEKRHPVLMVHGIFGSSGCFVVMGGNSLAFRLADEGFDVWMLNHRSVSYSRKLYPPDKFEYDKYWDFGLDELASYDLPAAIDYVLKKTKFPSLTYVGHSQGTTTFFMMSSDRPDYHKKINLFIGLGPAVHVSNFENAVAKKILQYSDYVKMIFDTLGTYGSNLEVARESGLEFCSLPNVAGICAKQMANLLEPRTNKINEAYIPDILRTMPEDISLRQLYQYGQMAKTKKFCKFDFYALQNFGKYSKFSPPCYNLDKINVPVALYYAPNDSLINMENVIKLSKELPHVIEMHEIADNSYSHIDFFLADANVKGIYEKIVKTMKNYKMA